MIDYRENTNWKVYAHISPSGKIYVGITKQENLTRRWGGAGQGYKNNPHFYRSIKKYGWENFQHEIIADNLTKNEAINLEKVLISGFKLYDPEYGYNLTNGGEAGQENAYKSRMKKVYKLDSDWNILEEYESCEKAKREIGIKNGSLHKAIIKGTRCKGYYWANDETYPLMKNKKKKQMNANVLQFDINGRFIREFDNAKDVEKQLGYSSESIRFACNGGTKTSHGYVWRYAFQYHGEAIKIQNPKVRPVAQFDIDGNFLASYDCFMDAERNDGFNADDIGKCCRGVKKTYRNFYWRYLDECEPQDDGSFLMPKSEKEA